MHYLFLLAFFLAGCQSALTPSSPEKQTHVLSGISFGYMTTSSKESKNALVKKAGFNPVKYDMAAPFIKNDFKALQDTMEPLNVRVNLVGRDLILTLLGDALFTNRLATALRSEAEAPLDAVVDYLKARKDTYVEITGYTDSVGNADANQRLSMEKARRITLYMVQSGVHPLRFFINGRGENSPISDSSTPENQALNRRIDIRISPMIE